MSRFDNVGMWWQDFPVERLADRDTVRNVAPPRTGWAARDFPNLSGVKAVGLDTETKDLELLSRGPGFVRGAAHVVGVSVATDDDAWYFPLRHEYAPEASLNLDPAKVFAWLDDVFSTRTSIVGANLMYDLEALRAEGVRHPAGRLLDVQFAEPLLDENRRSYALDVLANVHLGEGKETSKLYQWCADSFGGKVTGEQRKNIWRAPPSLVGPYAEADARLPLQILRKQWKLLDAEGLLDLFALECDLIPLLLDMRFRGVRVDTERARLVAADMRERAKHWQGVLGPVDAWSADSVARVFKKNNLEFLRTPDGAPSFTKDFLATVDHPVARAVLSVRKFEKAANPFVESYILGAVHNGRIHCQFHPLRSDNFGTVSGRFSSSNPNLQNIPSRDEELGPMIRSLFIPEEGCTWRKADHSQIEYRLLTHYAVGPGADEMRARYRDDPTTDYHEMTVELVRERTSVELGRKPAKNLNFGLVYGMGKDTLMRSLGVGLDLAEQLYEAYFTALPAVKKTYKSAERLARRRGYIKTVLGRRRRFVDDEPTHKALNSALQGGAADIIKRGMVDCYKAGVFDVTGVPHLTVHDELDWSDDGTPEYAEAMREAERILVECVPLRVPLRLGVDTGTTWGDCK